MDKEKSTRRETQQDASRRAVLEWMVRDKLAANGPLTALAITGHLTNDPKWYQSFRDAKITEVKDCLNQLHLSREVTLVDPKQDQPHVYVLRRRLSRPAAVDDDVLDALKQGPSTFADVHRWCGMRLHPSLDEPPRRGEVEQSLVDRLYPLGLVAFEESTQQWRLPNTAPKGPTMTTTTDTAKAEPPKHDDRTYKILHSLATASAFDKTDTPAVARAIGDPSGSYSHLFSELSKMKAAGLVFDGQDGGSYTTWRITDAGKQWLKAHRESALPTPPDSKLVARSLDQARSEVLSVGDNLRVLILAYHTEFKTAERRLDHLIDTYYSREFPDRVADVAAAAEPLLKARQDYESACRAGRALIEVAHELDVTIVPDLFPAGT